MKEKLTKIIKYAAFGVYALAMAILLFGRTPSYYRMVNLVPFKTVAQYLGYLSLDSYMLRYAIINLGGNIGMFIPLGFFLAAIWEKLRRFPWHLLTTAVIIVVVELIQVLTLTGTADIDDLILNVIGSAIGFGVYKVYCAVKNQIIKKKTGEINWQNTEPTK